MIVIDDIGGKDDGVVVVVGVVLSVSRPGSASRAHKDVSRTALRLGRTLNLRATVIFVVVVVVVNECERV